MEEKGVNPSDSGSHGQVSLFPSGLQAASIKDAMSDFWPQTLKNRFVFSEWYFKEYHLL